MSGEHAPAAFAIEPTASGEQVLMPGVQPISLRERLERRMDAPLLATKLQKPLDIGLFDLAARNQFDLFDKRYPPRCPNSFPAAVPD